MLYRSGNFFNHHDPTREPDRSAFLRRVERFQHTIKSPEKIIFLNFNGSINDLEELSTKTNAITISFKMHECKDSEPPSISHQSNNLIQVSLYCGTNTMFAKRRRLENSKKSLVTDGRFIECHLSRISAMHLMESLGRSIGS